MGLGWPTLGAAAERLGMAEVIGRVFPGYGPGTSFHLEAAVKRRLEFTCPYHGATRHCHRGKGKAVFGAGPARRSLRFDGSGVAGMCRRIRWTIDLQAPQMGEIPPPLPASGGSGDGLDEVSSRASFKAGVQWSPWMEAMGN